MTAEPAPEDGPPESAVDRLYSGWGQQVRWWHAAFGVIVALTLVAVVQDGTRGTPLLVTVVAMAAIVLAYVVWGARAALTREQGRALAYLVVLVAGTAVTVAQVGPASLLLFIAFAQVWMLLETIRRGVVGCLVLAAAVTVGIGARAGFTAEVLRDLVPEMLVTLVFAIGLGLWFHVSMQRAEEHSRLLDELRAAQAELARSNHESGVLAERARLAREIHDTLAQGFTSVVMQAQAASAALEVGDEAAARDRLHVMEDTARANLAEARALVAAFTPVALQDAPLPQALGRLADLFAHEAELVVDYRADGVGPLPAPIEVVLLRAAQEALANVRRHARARTVTVRLSRDGDEVVLVVTDDGQGIAPGVPDGFGLSGMRDRVRSVGGRLAVGPGPGGGTTLCARVPVEASPEGAADEVRGQEVAE
ncbi:sensor histidine kinase [Promicromonospora citrea]|uniref:Two-component sensor histidine kinase n=1 Tax=Promicromonospora citrea TaxID=43677 RepID=A0A8H9GRH9_9MICO|nr:sensor histidine kinase [Promicromonospora citrea]NNH51260.1 sensor histidine kinase [Promicromonospora citrea]GGM41597.1 two-component sensor histidine kinase [Promicromonospora citrea]